MKAVLKCNDWVELPHRSSRTCTARCGDQKKRFVLVAESTGDPRQRWVGYSNWWNSLVWEQYRPKADVAGASRSEVEKKLMNAISECGWTEGFAGRSRRKPRRRGCGCGRKR